MRYNHKDTVQRKQRLTLKDSRLSRNTTKRRKDTLQRHAIVNRKLNHDKRAQNAHTVKCHSNACEQCLIMYHSSLPGGKHVRV